MVDQITDLSSIDGAVIPYSDFVWNPADARGASGPWTVSVSGWNASTIPLTLQVVTDPSTLTYAQGSLTPANDGGRSNGQFLIATGDNDGIPVTFGLEVIGHNGDAFLCQMYTYNSSTGEFSFAQDQYEVLWVSTPDPLPDQHSQLTFSTDDPNAPFGLEVACFAAGTRIATADGDRAVEDLSEGDIVITASGAARPVKWIGHTTVRPARHARPHEVAPVRIKAGAFGPNLPLRDLRVSPGHAIYVDGVLIPAGCLVNGATIVQEVVESVEYFHVELEIHDVLLAEGLPCESYLDDGNRMRFNNAGKHIALHGRLDPNSWDDACAPMVAAGPQLDEVRRRLHACAEEMGWVKSEAANLRVMADSVEIAPLHIAGNRFWFTVPAASALALRSNAGVLAHTMPGLSDLRTLGVAITEVRLNGESLNLDGEAFADGFYPIERHGDHAWRWTNGNAALTPTVVAPAIMEVAVNMVAPSWTRRAAELRLVANA